MDTTCSYRWWGAAAGVVLGLVDTASLSLLGLRFALNGWDATPLVAAFFGTSFAMLGFLVGYGVEARRRDRAATEALAAARVRLAESQRLAALGQLAAAIAHEVRNPLAVIRSAAQGIAEEAPADAATGRATTFIIAEIDRLANVVTSLLAFVRPIRVESRDVALRDVVERALLLADDELAGKRLRLRRDDAAALPPVQGDADLLCQVVLGLLSNAAEAAPPGGDVLVGARPADGAVEVEVSDSGPGVPIELRERIFDPFFTTRSRGTGLGLAVARQIVEAHGGRIEVGERPGGGASFRVRLPAAQAAA